MKFERRVVLFTGVGIICLVAYLLLQGEPIKDATLAQALRIIFALAVAVLGGGVVGESLRLGRRVIQELLSCPGGKGGEGLLAVPLSIKTNELGYWARLPFPRKGQAQRHDDKAIELHQLFLRVVASFQRTVFRIHTSSEVGVSTT